MPKFLLLVNTMDSRRSNPRWRPAIELDSTTERPKSLPGLTWYEEATGRLIEL